MAETRDGWMESGECVWLTSDPDVATARERARALAHDLGFPVADQDAVELTISELATNLLTYARAGELRLEVVNGADSIGLRVIARDWGSGVQNLGLSDVQPRTGEFEIRNRAGRGTVVTVTKWLTSAKSSAA
jgi:serine/threonine-protein kinase RsbT